MEGIPTYRPSAEEIEKGELKMTEEQQMLSETREGALEEGGKRGNRKGISVLLEKNTGEHRSFFEKVLKQFDDQNIERGDRINVVFKKGAQYESNRDKSESAEATFKKLRADGYVEFMDRDPMPMLNIEKVTKSS